MLKDLVLRVLNQTVGEYFENIDASQLQLSVFGGDVALHNLKLKANVCESLGLPFRLSAGRCGTLTLKIPWTSLYSQPVEIGLKDLYLLVVPGSSVPYDENIEEKAKHKAKIRMVENIEAAQREFSVQQQHSIDSANSSAELHTNQSGYLEKLAMQIVRNLQIRIESIHIRYEDDQANSNKPFGMGVVLTNLSILTTDAEWNPKYISESVSTVHKLLNLEGLALYWNSKCQHLNKTHLKEEDRIDKLKHMLSEHQFFDYMVGPIQTTTKLRLNPTPEKSQFSTPKMIFETVVQELALSMSNLQFQDVLQLAENWDFLYRRQLHRKFRPQSISYKGHYRVWWKFAFNCVLEDIQRRRNNWRWVRMRYHRKDCRAYYNAMYKKVTLTKKVNPELDEELSNLETRLDIFNILLIRKQVDLRRERKEREEADAKKNRGWLGGWFASNPTESGNDSFIPDEMSTEEKNQLYTAIGYSENSPLINYPHDYVEVKVDFKLEKLKFLILQNTEREITTVLESQIANFETKLDTRPVKNGLKLSIKLGNIEAFGGDDNVQIITARKQENADYFIDMGFEKYPLKTDLDQRIFLKGQPLEITYDSNIVQKLFDCFTVSEKVSLQRLQAKALSKYIEWKAHSAAGLKRMVENRGKTEVDIKLEAPYFIVPRDGDILTASSVLVIELGELVIKSHPPVQDPNQQTLSVSSSHISTTAEQSDSLPLVTSTILNLTYDTFTIQLLNFQVSLAFAGETYRTSRTSMSMQQQQHSKIKKQEPVHLIKSGVVMMKIEQCIVNDDARFPRFKVQSSLPNIDLDISEHRLVQLVQLLVTLPLPKVQLNDNRDVAGESEIHLATDPTLNESIAVTQITYMEVANQGKTVEPIQLTALLLSVNIDSVKIRVSRLSSIKGIDQVISLELFSFKANMTSKTFGTSVDLKLGGVSLSAIVGKDMQKPLYLIRNIKSPEENEHLFHIHVFTINPDCPKTLFQKQIKQHISIGVASMEIVLHREVLTTLVDFLQELSSTLAEEIASHQIRIQQEQESLVGGKKRKQKSRIQLHSQAVAKKFGSDPNEILLKIEAKLEQLTVLMATNQKEIMKVVMKNLNGSYVQKFDKDEIFLQLIEFGVLNLDSTSFYKKILTFDSDRVIFIHVTKFNNAEITKKEDITKCSIRLQIETGSPKVYILSSFLEEVLSFTNNFTTATKAVKDAGFSAAEAATKNVKEAYNQDNNRISINIELKAPKIILPENDRSVTAIVCDFGNLHFSNTFTLLQVKNKYVIVDEMGLNIEDVKVSRVFIDKATQDPICECLLLDPVTFTGFIKRNLSSDWYRDIPGVSFKGKLHSTVVRISSEDFQVLVGCFNDKMKAIESADSEIKEVTSTDSKLGIFALEQQVDSISSDVSFSLDLNLNNLGAVLYQGTSKMQGKTGIVERDSKFSLAEFFIDSVNINFSTMDGGCFQASVILDNLDLKDSRPEKRAIRNLIQRKSESGKTGPMIKFKARKTIQETIIELNTTSLTLLLCLDHVVQVTQFFNISYENDLEIAPSSADIAKYRRKHAITPKEAKKLKGLKSATQLKEHVRTPESTTPFKGHFKLEAMEVVFVEDMESVHNTNAVILNCEMSMDISTNGDDTDIVGVLEGLKLNTCNYNAEHRNQTLAEVISPTTMMVMGKRNPQVGLELEVTLSDIFIRLSAGTVTLLTKITDSFNISSPNYLQSNQYQDNSHIWETKAVYDHNLWYLTPNAINEHNCLSRVLPEEPKFTTSDLKLPALEKSHEKLIFKSGSIVLTFEAGSEVITAPLLLIEASSEFQAVDWSSELELGGKVQLAAAYFNPSVGMWEYLIEPVPLGQYQSFNWKPLEVLFSLNQGETDEFSHLLRESASTLVCLNDEEGIKRGSEIVCTFQINEIIEFTLTMTALNVLSMLGDTFESAAGRGTKSLVSKNKISTAPYILNNLTGVDLHVDLNGTPFVAVNDETEEVTKRFKLVSGTDVELSMANDYTRYSILKEQQMEEERWIRIVLPHIKFQAKIAIDKAQIRCYSISASEDIMTCEVWVKDCSRVVTFRGGVQIINDLNVDVDLITKKDGHVYSIEAKSGPYSVPLKYLSYKSESAPGFYFAPARYKQSIEAFELNQIAGASSSAVSRSRQLEDSSKVTKFLSCPNYAGDDTFYIKVVSKSKQVYLENTKRLALNCMNHEIRLEPTFLINNMLPVPIAYVNSVGDEIEVAERGKMIQVTNLRVNNNNPSALFDIPLRVKGYDDLNWDCRISVGKNTEKLSAWCFVSVNDSTELTLGIYKDHSSEEQMVLHLYAPFWMINRTGLNLSYKGEREKQVTKHPTDRQIVLFSYPVSTFFNKTNKAQVKSEEADWSATFPTETVGLSSFLSCKSFKKKYQFGLTIKLCHGGLTKMIIFTPKFYVMNQCNYLVNLSEESSSEELELQPGLCVPFWPKGADSRLTIRVEEEKTKPFLYETGHSTLLRLNNQYGGLQADVNVGETRIVITLSEYTSGKAPNLFLNATDDILLGFRQTGQELKDQGIIAPGESQLVCWPNPAGTRIMLWYPLNSDLKPSISKEFEDPIVSDTYFEFQWKNTSENTSSTYYWISFIEELQRITVLTKDPFLAKYLKSSRDVELPTAEVVLMFTGLGLSLVDNVKCKEIIYMRMSSTGVIWEEDISSKGRLRPFEKEVSDTLESFYQSYTNNKQNRRIVGVYKLDSGMEVDLKSMKMKKPHDRYIRRCPKMPGFWSHIKIFPHSTQFHMKINKLQIDNQLGDATFVFFLAPASVAKSVANTNEELRKPFVEMVFSTEEKGAHTGTVLQYIYCSFLVQEFQLKLDMGLINALTDFFNIQGDSTDNKLEKMIEDQRKDYLTAIMSLEEHQKKTIVSIGSKRFYNYLHLSPLKVRVSFSMNGSSNESNNVILLLLQGLGIDKLADFQDVPFQLACFELQNKQLTDDQLVSKVISHYTTQGIKQFYVLILGLDFLGNPYALLTGITEGVTAFFYEPIQGAILGPDAFREGLSLGVKSLVGHTVGGAAEALSKVTGTIGKGFAAMTMDDEFQKKRNESLRQGQGQGQSTSFGATAKGFFKTGIMDTVAGIVTNPIKGAQEEGFQGFGKGLLRGAVGIVTRPVVGAADLARGTLDTFRRALQDNGDLSQIRPPRPVQCSFVLQPYNIHAGKGNQIAQELVRHNEKPYLKKERYLAHAVVEVKHVLFLTERRILYLKLTDDFGGSTIIWEHEWSDFAMPPYAVEKGVEFQLKPEVVKKTGGFLRQNTAVTQLFVPMTDPELCMWIMNEVVEAMVANNQEEEVSTSQSTT